MPDESGLEGEWKRRVSGENITFPSYSVFVKQDIREK